MRTPPINPKIIATLPVFVSVSIAAILIWLANAPSLTMPFVLGIIAGGLVDLDNGLTGRIQNIVFTAIAFSLATISVQMTLGTGLPFILVMVGLTFSFTWLGAVSLRYRTIAFGALAVATYTALTYTPEIPWLLNPILILLGTLLYSIITLLLHIVFPHRPVQESMAKAFFRLGNYFDAKAAFFDPDEADCLDDQRLHLAAHNTRVIEAFNECRRALFYRMRGQHRHPRTTRMLRYYFIVQDMHERISSTHADYRDLAQHLKNTDLIFRIHRLLELQAQACRDVAESLRSNTPYEYGPRLTRAIAGCQQSLELYARHHNGPNTHTVQRLLDNLFGIDYQLSHLESNNPEAVDSTTNDTTRIAAQDKDGPRHIIRTLHRHFSLESVIFRHAVRLAIVVGIACCVVEVLAADRGYWILLTAIFVCQPNYSATKSRVNQRIAGTILGVIAGSLVPYFTPSMATKLWIIVVCTTLFFFSRNYKYSWSTFFVTIQAIASLSLMGMDVYTAMPLRIVDTIIGASLAWAAAYFLWPDWNYMTLGRTATQAISSSAAYLRQIIQQLQHGSVDDVAYRTIRRQAHESAAALSSTLSDMSSQPAKYADQLQGGFTLLKTTYALLGYISALGAYRNRMAQASDPRFSSQFFATAYRVADLLGSLPRQDRRSFSTALHTIEDELQTLQTHIRSDRQNSILWQQLRLIAAQLDRCHHILATSPMPETAPHAAASDPRLPPS